MQLRHLFAVVEVNPAFGSRGRGTPLFRRLAWSWKAAVEGSLFFRMTHGRDKRELVISLLGKQRWAHCCAGGNTAVFPLHQQVCWTNGEGSWRWPQERGAAGLLYQQDTSPGHCLTEASPVPLSTSICPLKPCAGWNDKISVSKKRIEEPASRWCWQPSNAVLLDHHTGTELLMLSVKRDVIGRLTHQHKPIQYNSVLI